MSRNRFGRQIYNLPLSMDGQAAHFCSCPAWLHWMRAAAHPHARAMRIDGRAFSVGRCEMDPFDPIDFFFWGEETMEMILQAERKRSSARRQDYHELNNV